MAISAVEVSKAPTPFRFESTSNSSEGRAWLKRYFQANAPVVIGDDAGTTFLSCAAIITSAVALCCDVDLLLAEATQFPIPFVTAVCGRMKAHKLWDHPEVVTLQRLIQHHRQDSLRISEQVQAVGDVFWDANWTPETEFALEALRQRVVFGGASQHWIDTGALSFFGLLEYQSIDLQAKA